MIRNVTAFGFLCTKFRSWDQSGLICSTRSTIQEKKTKGQEALRDRGLIQGAQGTRNTKVSWAEEALYKKH